MNRHRHRDRQGAGHQQEGTERTNKANKHDSKKTRKEARKRINLHEGKNERDHEREKGRREEENERTGANDAHGSNGKKERKDRSNITPRQSMLTFVAGRRCRCVCNMAASVSVLACAARGSLWGHSEKRNTWTERVYILLSQVRC